MIYKSSYLSKELRQAYTDRRTGLRRRIGYAVFTGLVAFAIFFVLQTLKDSVLSDAIPSVMQRSLFATVTVYVNTAFVLIAGYLMAYYDTLFFSEIRRNAWYLLVKMGLRPQVMIVTKLFAQFYAVVMMYTLGFVVIIVMTVFLKATMVFMYLASLYISGLIDLLLITAYCMTLSLFVKTLVNARYLILLGMVVVLVLKYALGMYSVLTDRVLAQFFGSFISASAYPLVAVSLTAACLLLSMVLAGRQSGYYRNDDILTLLPHNARIEVAEHKTGKLKPVRSVDETRRVKLADSIITGVLMLFIGAALILNVFIILIGTATPGNEVTISGTIPYIFASDTMEPHIQVNDLAYFKRVDMQYPFKVGDIVLFKHDGVVYVQTIVEMNETAVTVDISHYPPEVQTGVMVKTIERDTIYGIYSGRSRWLGALILFSNTIVGRIVFLLVPAVLLFYHGRIARLFAGQNRYSVR